MATRDITVVGASGAINDALLMQQTETLEIALRMALRALEESAGLNTRVARRAEARGDSKLVTRLNDQAQAAERRARVIRPAARSHWRSRTWGVRWG